VGVVARDTSVWDPVETLFDSEWIKGISGRRALAPGGGWRPRVHGTDFDEHQDWALGCFLRYDQFLLFSDTGLGKTKSALDALDYHFQKRGLRNALVITGTATATGEWTDQAAKFIRTDVHDVQGTPAQRRQQLTHFPTAPITATDYSTLQTVFAKRVAKRRGGFKFVADFELLSAFGRMFGAIVLDEIHRLANTSSLRHQMVAALASDIPVRYGLTGTPFDRHPEQAWPQYWIVDQGATFKTQQEFLAHFFETKPSYWSVYQNEVRLRKDRKDDFRRRWRNRGIRITSKECKNLPESVRHTIRVPMPKGAAPHMKAARERVIAARQDGEFKSEFTFLRQLCSGLLRVHAGTKIVDGEAQQQNALVRLESSTKLEWCLAFLDRLPETEQVIIFYEFTASGEWLVEALTAAKEKVSWLHGGMGVRGPEVIAEWKKKKTRVLVTQTEMASESLNLQQAAYLIQYEAPLTFRKDKQSTARVAGRIGGRPSTIYTLTVKGSSERRILELIHEGRTLSRELLEIDDDPSTMGREPSTHRSATTSRVRLLNR
jgi:superfamily II DNA or RNA helicase